MNPILQAAGMMGQAKIVRRATAKTFGRTVFLWQLSDGRTLELVREGQFKSVVERTETFDSLLEFYQRGHCPRCQDSCRLIGFTQTEPRGRKEPCNAALLC